LRAEKIGFLALSVEQVIRSRLPINSKGALAEPIEFMQN
jgi:hypothetical protein